MARRSRWFLALPMLALGCGGGSPAKPTQASSASSSVNTAPVVSSLIAQGARRAEPPNLADANEELVVTASVSDVETPVERLTFEWSSPVGTFSGQGPSVRWR